MMRNIVIVFILIFSNIIIHAFDKGLEFNPGSPINLGDNLQTGKLYEKEITITNNSETGVVLNDISVYPEDGRLTFSNNNGVILKNSEMKTTLKLRSKHNINLKYYAYFVFEKNNNTFTKKVIINAQFRYENDYYSSTFDLYGEELKDELHNIIKDHRFYTYKEARNLFWTKFDSDENNEIEDVYTGRKVTVSDPPNFSKLDQMGFNTEHTWPRGEGSGDEPELSDIFHIYCSDKNANSKRANLKFGNVTNNEYYSDGGSKAGYDASGVEVFEPRDTHKGNVARSMFYFATRYGNKNQYLTYQEPVLREWMHLDKVDKHESVRNDSIFKYQENRNPFIDHPEFLERTASISNNGDLPDSISAGISEDTLNFDFSTQINGSYPFNLTTPLYVYNQGNTDLTIQSIELNTSDNSQIEINYNGKLPAAIDSMDDFMISFKNNRIDELNPMIKGTITLKDHENINFFIKTFPFTSVNYQEKTNNLISIIPNPTKGIVNINLKEVQNISEAGLYTILGKKIANLSANKYSYQIDLNTLQITNNIIILSVITDDKSFSKIIVFKK